MNSAIDDGNAGMNIAAGGLRQKPIVASGTFETLKPDTATT
jgi:hypothetical protein